jgi:hypothetical protein
MKMALFIGVSLTLVALPAAAQYARSGQSAGGYRGGNIPAAPSVSHKRYAALEFLHVAGAGAGSRSRTERLVAGPLFHLPRLHEQARAAPLIR